ncbi:mannose-P-dolichol utilization defect 1 protein-like isoform X1 [Dreissena polymorpha]|uniref:mannose-P-dolichol utilization defect 1 protein-like isoform X1 n=1 Tax=Dreissena polymorpha TaxID=45954 RepID=UPI002264D418|nr:mannose-P-dolichol utilization defect 1 protein-like isoform X1 [Dreissena polymorpha]
MADMELLTSYYTGIITSRLDRDDETLRNGVQHTCFHEIGEIVKRRHVQGSCLLTVLGYILIGTMTISQVPQIFKILRKRSTLGVSFCSHLLLLQASSSTVAYAIYNRFPFSAWGEHIVLMFMFVVLVCLLLQYNKRPVASLVFMTVYILCMVLLLWPTVPQRLVQTLYLLSMPAMVLSRVLQMYKIHRTKCTGQLSATSSFLCIFQGLGRITTSILTTGDRLMIIAFAIGSLFNVLLFLQVMFYRRKTKKVA